MEDCRELFAVLSDYLDAELPPADCAAIEKHIAACAPCVEFVDSLKKTIALCRGAGTQAEAPRLTAEVRDKLMVAYRASKRTPN